MLVQENEKCGTGRSSLRSSSLLDSPTLARVERAMLRHDEGICKNDHLLRNTHTQSLIPSNYMGKDTYDAIKKGLLWQHRDKLFSRWKERYFILTRDYLHCFRRATGANRITEMGQFLFKVKLVDVDTVEWENRKTYSVIALVLMGREGKVCLRSTNELEEWFELMEECIRHCKKRRISSRNTFDPTIKNGNGGKSVNDWLLDCHGLNIGQSSTAIDSAGKDIVHRRRCVDKELYSQQDTLDNRLSLLTDIDINSYTTSITSYRLNEDVLCIQTPSFRNTECRIRDKELMIPNESPVPYMMRFRERSCSDIQRSTRLNWRMQYNIK